MEKPIIDKKIKFETSYGWLTGWYKEVKMSYGDVNYFFIVEHIRENKHWTYFKDTEIYKWEYV